MADIPHISLPIRIVGRAYAVNDQDSEDDLVDCVQAICQFEREYRVEQPEFGILDPTFATMPINTNDIINQINKWEPRADVDVSLEFNPDGTQEVHIKMLHPEDDDEET